MGQNLVACFWQRVLAGVFQGNPAVIDRAVKHNRATTITAAKHVDFDFEVRVRVLDARDVLGHVDGKSRFFQDFTRAGRFRFFVGIRRSS